MDDINKIVPLRLRHKDITVEEYILTLKKAHKSFKFFMNNVFPWGQDDLYITARHLDVWSWFLQLRTNTCILAPRKHGKSFHIYGYVLWHIFCGRVELKDKYILYMSYSYNMAHEHVTKIKRLLKRNPWFDGLQELSTAEGVGKYTWDGEHILEINPEGILSFNRGKHPEVTILDDVMRDPTSMMNLTQVMRVNEIFFTEVMQLPKEGVGVMKIIGTAMTPEDFFFKIRNTSEFKDGWQMSPAITNEATKETLWPTVFSYERLMSIKDTIGEKAFRKEYMIEPVYVTEAFFLRENILALVKNTQEIQDVVKGQDKANTVMGWDIGKKSHPTHLSIFKMTGGTPVQIYQKFLDNTDYIKQLDFVKGLVEMFKVDKVFYDATRGELDGFAEQGIMRHQYCTFEPVIFTFKEKAAMASEFEKYVTTKNLILINDSRMIEQILTVTNDLQAVETAGGHGDCYDDQTELLTSEGWKYFKDLNKTEKVATLSENGYVEWQKPSDYIVKEYDGMMYSVDTSQINLKVTPLHKMFVNGKLRAVKDIEGLQVKYKKNAKWNGEQKEYFNVMNNKVKSEDWLEFLGYYISEGHTTKRKGKYQIGISQNEPKRTKIRECLKRLPFKFTENEKGFWIYNSKLGKILHPLGKSGEKYIPDGILELNSRLLEILYQAMMYGDGTFNRTFRSYFTSSYRLAGQFQELLLKVNRSGNIYVRDFIGRRAPHGITRLLCYNIGVIEKKNNPMVNKHKNDRNQRSDRWSVYKGKIYCVTVPNHVIYVRREGKPCWSGNSFWSIAMALKGLAEHRFKILVLDDKEGLIF